MGNDVASEIKIANANGEMEGGDNKQWHMDQGDFDENEKKDFENKQHAGREIRFVREVNRVFRIDYLELSDSNNILTASNRTLK